MTERIVFLDIDGPIIPNGMYLIDRGCSFKRNIPPIPVAIVRAMCERAAARVVFNTTHNRPIDGVADIVTAMVTAGLPEDCIHPDAKTLYPRRNIGFNDNGRMDSVLEWLSRHPVTDWVALDDARFTDKDNLIWIDPDAGLHVGHLNQVLKRWGATEFFVL